MTLSQLRKKYPKRFYRGQDWLDGETFVNREAGQPLTMPKSTGADHNGTIVSAVDLALLYIEHPNDPLWQRFLWTSDFDDLGQRVYVGGIGQAKKPGFQIHRHLKVTGRQWVWPIW